ncbi:hypothetical protein [Saccharicrinis sp. 156]|uniref:hypothetical protein n=1 Tax=Saccharicrinis sp. 156 TaxID=3417574 RepID=UPI003D356767
MGNTKRKFTPAFWTANFAELLERAAYYGVFIVITLYLSRILAFDDIEAAAIAGTFSALLYLLPTFAGAYADKIGFKKSLIVAFSLLTLGYLGLGLLPTFIQNAGLAEYGTETVFKGLDKSNFRYAILPVMALIILGEVLLNRLSLARSLLKQARRTGLQVFRFFIPL